MSRYVSRADTSMSEPVPVTCDGCRIATAGDLWFQTRPVANGREFMGFTSYDDMPVTMCGDCAWRDPPRFTRAGSRKCPHCHRRFFWWGRRRRYYCTDRCGADARTVRRRRRATSARAKVCANPKCCKGFDALRTDGRYCSGACRQKTYRDRLAARETERAEYNRLMRDYGDALMGGAS